MGFLVLFVLFAAVGAGVAYKLGMLNQYLPPHLHAVQAEADTKTAKTQHSGQGKAQ